MEEVRNIPEGWEEKKIGELLKIKHGKSQKEVEDSKGKYPILGSGGQIGWSKKPLYKKESVLIGRKGTINKPQYINIPFWTIDTLFYSDIKKSMYHYGYIINFVQLIGLSTMKRLVYQV
ncbi:MAG: restriction endonuclease subunit S [Halanaerobiales bacterium]|nr:restriction endonuclease subunit S [Halanaerobiales bacterium]